MKLYCKYSGIRFDIFANILNTETKKQERVYSFTGLQAEGIHPIFYLPPAILLTKAEDWAARRLTATETRLLFLALLNSIGLVEFRNSALPAQNTIEQNMEPLLKAVLWYTNFNSGTIELPKYVISNSSQTHRLESVSTWIAEIERKKEDWYNRFERSNLADRMQHKETLLEKLIHSQHRKTAAYGRKLASWAFDATAFPDKTDEDKATRDRWTSLFMLKGWDIYTADRDELEDMLDYFERNLNVYKHVTFAKAVLTHIRDLLEKNRLGIQQAIGMIDGNTFEIVPDAIELHNRTALAANAPTILPTEQMVPSVYPTRVKYLAALAAYRIAQEEKKRIGEQEEKQKEAIKQAALAITTEEEVEADAGDDENQIRMDFHKELGLVDKHVVPASSSLFDI